MKYSMIQEVVVGVGVAMMALSCADQSSVQKPATPQATVTASGEIESGANLPGRLARSTWRKD